MKEVYHPTSLLWSYVGQAEVQRRKVLPRSAPAYVSFGVAGGEEKEEGSV